MKRCLAAAIASSCPGTLVVLAPKGAGKTTRAIEAGQALKAAGIISDFALADLKKMTEDMDPYTFVMLKLGGNDAIGLVMNVTNIIPERANHDKPALIIVDSTESLQGRLADAKDLCYALSKQSVDCGGRFDVLALCGDLEGAEAFLRANGGEKVMALHEGDVLEAKCRLQPEQCLRLLEKKTNSTGASSMMPTAADLEEATACATKGGTWGPGAIQFSPSGWTWLGWLHCGGSQEAAKEDGARTRELEGEPQLWHS